MAHPESIQSLPSARTFRASRTYIAGPGMFILLLLLACLGVLALRHQVSADAAARARSAIAFLGLFVTAVTLRITMDADGLTQRWIWGRRQIGWHQIASIERTKRGPVSCSDEKGKEILAVSALPPADQQAVVDEAVKRGRLRRDKQAQAADPGTVGAEVGAALRALPAAEGRLSRPSKNSL